MTADVYGDDQVSRAYDWAAAHPGWLLLAPAFREAPGSSTFETWRLAGDDVRLGDAELREVMDQAAKLCEAGQCGEPSCPAPP